MRAAIIGGGVIGAGWAARFLLKAEMDDVGFYRRHGFEPWGVQMYLVQTDESRTEPTGG